MKTIPECTAKLRDLIATHIKRERDQVQLLRWLELTDALVAGTATGHGEALPTIQECARQLEAHAGCVVADSAARTLFNEVVGAIARLDRIALIQAQWGRTKQKSALSAED